jgi:hypothetical protein
MIWQAKKDGCPQRGVPSGNDPVAKGHSKSRDLYKSNHQMVAGLLGGPEQFKVMPLKASRAIVTRSDGMREEHFADNFITGQGTVRRQRRVSTNPV